MYQDLSCTILHDFLKCVGWIFISPACVISVCYYGVIKCMSSEKYCAKHLNNSCTPCFVFIFLLGGKGETSP